jgi:hypothetical protein
MSASVGTRDPRSENEFEQANARVTLLAPQGVAYLVGWDTSPVH